MWEPGQPSALLRHRLARCRQRRRKIAAAPPVNGKSSLDHRRGTSQVVHELVGRRAVDPLAIDEDATNEMNEQRFVSGEQDAPAIRQSALPDGYGDHPWVEWSDC